MGGAVAFAQPGPPPAVPRSAGRSQAEAHQGAFPGEAQTVRRAGAPRRSRDRLADRPFQPAADLGERLRGEAQMPGGWSKRGVNLTTVICADQSLIHVPSHVSGYIVTTG